VDAKINQASGTHYTLHYTIEGHVYVGQGHYRQSSHVAGFRQKAKTLSTSATRPGELRDGSMAWLLPRGCTEESQGRPGDEAY